MRTFLEERGSLVALAGLVLMVVPFSSNADDRPPAADMVIRHARVITLDRDSRIAEAVAIRGERLLAVGTDAEIARHIGPATRVVDAGGKVLLPGLYDSHVHPLGAAHSEKDHPIPTFDSLADVLRYISERAKVQPERTWIVARYAFPDPVEGRPLPHPRRARPGRSAPHGAPPGRARGRRQHAGPAAFRHHP